MNRSKSRIILGTVLLCLGLILTACGGKPTQEAAAPPELPEDVESLVMLAKFDLSLRTGQDLENILTKNIEETLFDDSSLGVPQPGVEYEAMITPGYIITLTAGGETYEYHASGAKVVQVPKD